MAFLHSINLTSIGETELYAAVSDFVGTALPPGDRTQEGYTVDFKQEWSEKSPRHRGLREHFGGVIVVGVSEAAGRADQVIGVTTSKELTMQIASSIASNISPPSRFRYRRMRPSA